MALGNRNDVRRRGVYEKPKSRSEVLGVASYELERPNVVVTRGTRPKAKKPLTARRVLSALAGIVTTAACFVAGFMLVSLLAERVIDWRADYPMREVQEAYAEEVEERVLSAVSETIVPETIEVFEPTVNVIDEGGERYSLPLDEVEVILVPDGDGDSLVKRTETIAKFAPSDERCLWVEKTITRQVSKREITRTTYKLNVTEGTAKELGIESMAHAELADTASTDRVLLDDSTVYAP